jgi:hypothetical protein
MELNITFFLILHLTSYEIRNGNIYTGAVLYRLFFSELQRVSRANNESTTAQYSSIIAPDVCGIYDQAAHYHNLSHKSRKLTLASPCESPRKEG